MADDVKDIAIYTGSEWTSLSELAAGVVDCTLPISDEADTVTVDGASNVFTVSTNGTEALKIAANHDTTFDGHIGVMGVPYSTVSIALHGDVKPFNPGGAYAIWASPNYIVDPDATYPKHARAFGSVKAPANGVSFDTFTAFYSAAVCGNAVVRNYGVYVSAQGAINNIGLAITNNGAVVEGNWGVYDNTGYDSFFNGDIKVPRIAGKADNDAAIKLGKKELLTENHSPVSLNAIATVQYVLDNAGDSYDDTQIKEDVRAEASTRAAADAELQQNIDAKIWVGTTEDYNAIDLNDILPTTLYCLTD